MTTQTLIVRVGKIKREAVDVKSFELVSADGSKLPPFSPGAHIDVHVNGFVRQYSLCNVPSDQGRYSIAVKREIESRGGSKVLHEQIVEGDLLKIGVPRNNFPLNRSASCHLLLGGGIGITPLLSMAYHLREAGTPFELKYFVRSVEHAAFYDVLTSAPLGNRVECHCGLDPCATEATLTDILRFRPNGCHVYACGPRPFLESVSSTARKSWSPESLHFEYFSSTCSKGPVDKRSFQVKLARSGNVFTVPEGRSIVEVLSDHGVNVEVSCRQGVCGTCLTRVLEGLPEHRDEVLSAEMKEAGNVMALCVSRSKTNLIIIDL